MKKFKDFIGDCIIEIMVGLLYIIAPFAIIGGLCHGFYEKNKKK